MPLVTTKEHCLLMNLGTQVHYCIMINEMVFALTTMTEISAYYQQKDMMTIECQEFTSSSFFLDLSK
jgi:hypothetical protein